MPLEYTKTKPPAFSHENFTEDINTSSLGLYLRKIIDTEFEIKLFFTQEIDETILDNIITSNQPTDPYKHISNYPDTSISGSPDTSTSNSEYTSVKVFVYPGKAKTGYPGEIHLIATVDASTTSGNVRLYDLTNRKVVAEMTDITDTTPVILSMPFTKANLPVEKSEFSIQLKCSSTTSSTSKKITFHSMLMDYSP